MLVNFQPGHSYRLAHQEKKIKKKMQCEHVFDKQSWGTVDQEHENPRSFSDKMFQGRRNV